MALPGISFEIVRSGGPVLGIRADTTAMFALTERGPAEVPTLVHSHDDFMREFGCPVDGMLGAHAARLYFDNGGEELIVIRFVSAAALHAIGEIPVVKPAPGPLPIELRARDLGAFGNRIVVRTEVTVRHRVRAVLDTPASTALVSGLSTPRFTLADVKMRVRVITADADFWTHVTNVAPLTSVPQMLTFADAVPGGDGEDAIVEVHEPTFTLRITEPNRADVFVSGLDLRDEEAALEALAPTAVTITGGFVPATDFAQLPDTTIILRLSEGADGLDLPGNPVALAASFERGLAALELSEIVDVMIAPDLWSRIFATKGVKRLAFSAEQALELGDEMALSALHTRDRVALLDPPLTGFGELRPAVGQELVDWRATREQTLAEGPDTARDFVATYTPWTRIVAGPVFKGDDTLLFPPSAAVAGQMAKTSRERGPWIATGNVALEDIVGLAELLDQGEAEVVQDVGISPLLMSLPRGATIQGVRSLSWPDRKAWRFLTTRRLFNYLRRALKPIGLSYVFEPNSPETWIALRRDLERLLRDLFAAGALAGASPSEAFFVKVDDTLNPEEARTVGVLTAQIGVAPAKPLEFLLVRLIVAGGVTRVAEEPIAS